jgi:hypothetical protein
MWLGIKQHAYIDPLPVIYFNTTYSIDSNSCRGKGLKIVIAHSCVAYHNGVCSKEETFLINLVVKFIILLKSTCLFGYFTIWHLIVLSIEI